MPVFGINDINRKLERLGKTLVSIVPKRIAADAERHFKDSFRNQGFTDKSLVKWRRTKKGKAGRILKKTGNLSNSIRIERADATAIRIVAGGQHVPYAKAHNEGLMLQRQVTRRAHWRAAHKRRTKRGAVNVPDSFVRRHQARLNLRLVKRQFMGRSAVLEQTMRRTILRSIAEVTNS